ncbi:MAG: TrkH family potassium uptake protein [Prevotellaceae bacterium]|jgi:trk system potassium uptake protein TrkH|nr:TrkH family potassium uptake protein [Prevotellaceae bacterium]
MRFPVIVRYAGFVLLLNAAFMLAAAVVSLLQGGEGLWVLIISAVITAIAGGAPLPFVKPVEDLTAKEGTGILAFSWIMSCTFGMLPYLFWGGEFTFIDAWFESVSGYTTTGATVLNHIEQLPEGLLFWRSATHWMGGLGVVVLLVLVLPTMYNLKIRLAKVEISTLSKGNFKFHVQQTARVICIMFIGLTVLLCGLLMLAGMDWFDAVNHAFSTIATGGFSTRDASIFAFHNGWIELILSVFMIISGMHFGLLFMAFTGNARPLWKSPAVRFYLTTMLAGIVFISLNLYFSGVHDNLFTAFRYGGFQVLSIGTTTGFATADTTQWPVFSTLLLYYFMLQCACAGSTSGGIKADRIQILFWSIRGYIRKQQHPNAVVPTRVGGNTLDNDTVYAVLQFVITYIMVVFFGAIVLSLLGVDLSTGFSASAACMGNVGPGFGEAGSFGNYDGIPALGKLVLTFEMLLGRLEIYALLLFLFVKSWR